MWLLPSIACAPGNQPSAARDAHAPRPPSSGPPTREPQTVRPASASVSASPATAPKPLPVPPALPDKLCPSMQGPYASVSPDGALVALLGLTEVQIRDTETGKLRGILPYPGLNPNLAWFPDSRRLAIPEGTHFTLWNRSTASQTRIPVESGVSAVRPSPDGSRLLALGKNGVTLFHVETEKSLAQVDLKLLPGSGNGYPQGQWVASGKVFALGDWSRKIIRIYDGMTGAFLREVNRADLLVSTMKPSPSKDHLAVAEASAKIEIIDAHTGELVSPSRFLGTASGSLQSFAWDPAGTRIAFLSSGATVELGIWNVYTYRIISLGYYPSADSISWNNHGTRIGIWSRSQGISILDVENVDAEDLAARAGSDKGRVLFPSEGQAFDGVWAPDMTAVLKTYDKRWEKPLPPDYLDGRLEMVDIDTNRERFRCPTREPLVDEPDAKPQKASSKRKRKS